MKRFAPILVAALTLQGCAAVALMAGGIVAGAGVDHTLSGITYKTFNAPSNRVRLAALKALHRMDIKVTEEKKIDEGRQIVAEAAEREIEIEFEALTKRTTRMRVVVNKGAIFKDSATATEIVLQTADALQRDASMARAAETKAANGKKNKKKTKP